MAMARAMVSLGIRGLVSKVDAVSHIVMGQP